MLVATLVAAAPLLTPALVARVAQSLQGSSTYDIFDGGWAADIVFSAADPQSARTQIHAALSAVDPIDVIVQPHATRQKRLLVADMDSTMITIECIDELADFIGRKQEVSAVTEAAMQGTLDFVAALDARVALLRGLPVATLEQCYQERVRYSPGARTLIRTLGAQGAETILVSGGFTFFTERVAAHLGFTTHRANHLDIAEDKLAGTVARPIVTAEVKRTTLQDAQHRLGLVPAQTLAIGDGANDILMIEAAGLGIAYRAKPKTEAAADAALRHADLTALLYAQGITRHQWIE